MKKIILVVLFFSLYGCFTTVVMQDSTAISPGKGILVTNIKTNSFFKLSTVQQSGMISESIFEIKPGETLQVTEVPAGDYYWRGVYIGTSAAEFGEKYPFKIEAGSINYIGDIKILVEGDKVYLKPVDNSKDTMAIFAKRFPNLSQNKIINNITKVNKE